jgi:hypothetical protein
MQAGSAGELKRRTVASTGRTGSAIENAGRFCRRIKTRNCRVGQTHGRTHALREFIYKIHDIRKLSQVFIFHFFSMILDEYRKNKNNNVHYKVTHVTHNVPQAERLPTLGRL